MNWRFLYLYRGFLALLLTGVFWSVWTSAQVEAPVGGAAVSNKVAVAGNGPNYLPLLPLASGHALTFGLDEVGFLQHAILGQPAWKYLASLLYIFLAFYVSKLLDWVIGVWLKRWAEKSDTKLDDLILGLLRGPVKVISFAVFFYIGLDLFEWPDAVQMVLAKGLMILVAFSVTYVLLRILELGLGLWRQRASTAVDPDFDQHLFPILSKSLKAFVVVVAVLVTAQNLGINITGLIASASVAGLAIGLAAQDTLANLFGAVAVYLDKPFRIGDRIRLDAVDGTVESIGLRSTRVRNLDGHLVTIPNKTVGNATITNVAARPNIKTELNLGITYDTPAARVLRATDLLREIFTAHPKTLDLVITFNRFDNSALNLQVIHWWGGTDFKEHMAALQALNLSIKERFDREGIEFAFPTQTLYVRQEAGGKPA
jgi:MscS family membrane protein